MEENILEPPDIELPPAIAALPAGELRLAMLLFMAAHGEVPDWGATSKSRLQCDSPDLPKDSNSTPAN